MLDWNMADMDGLAFMEELRRIPSGRKGASYHVHRRGRSGEGPGSVGKRGQQLVFFFFFFTRSYVLFNHFCGGTGEPLAPHRPFKIIYATLYYDVRPTFVVDITHSLSRNLLHPGL